MLRFFLPAFLLHAFVRYLLTNHCTAYLLVFSPISYYFGYTLIKCWLIPIILFISFIEFMPRTKKVNLESSLESLEALITRMETGGLSLEDSLKEFEQGIKLVHSCQESLNNAEQKVDILLKKSVSAKPTDFT